MINELLNIFGWFLILHWNLLSTFTIIGLIGFFTYKPKKSKEKTSNYEFVVVSKACKEVEESLLSTIIANKKWGNLSLVIDEDSDLEHFLKGYCAHNNIPLYVVPKKFECKAIAKGRAIEYFIQQNVKDPERWYVFVDDDNLILDDNFAREIPHYDSLGFGAFNSVLIPRKSTSNTSYVMDWIRYFDDLTLFRFFTGGLEKPLNGMHGELFGVKGKYLKQITFNRKTVTEDFAFARELLKRNIPVWQSNTKVSILSPGSVKDLLKQRKRWYTGISRDVLSAPLSMKLVAGLKTLDWKIGILGSWMLSPLWIFLPMFNTVPLPLRLYALVGMFYYVFAYGYGSIQNIKTGRSLLGGIKDVLGIVIYGIIENYAPHTKKQNGFVVINKNGGKK